MRLAQPEFFDRFDTHTEEKGIYACPRQDLPQKVWAPTHKSTHFLRPWLFSFTLYFFAIEGDGFIAITMIEKLVFNA